MQDNFVIFTKSQNKPYICLSVNKVVLHRESQGHILSFKLSREKNKTWTIYLVTEYSITGLHLVKGLVKMYPIVLKERAH
jgi:hypothetical protein